MSYSIIKPPFLVEHETMTKKELREYFDWFQTMIPERIRELTHAVRGTFRFQNWEPDLTPESLDELGHWFVGQIEIRSRTEHEVQEIKNHSASPIKIPREELDDKTLSLAMDVGIYISQVFLKNHPTLRWDQPLKNNKYAHYGHAVLAGFRAGIYEDHFNPMHMMKVFAYDVAKKGKDAAGLQALYSIWEKKISK